MFSERSSISSNDESTNSCRPNDCGRRGRKDRRTFHPNRLQPQIQIHHVLISHRHTTGKLSEGRRLITSHYEGRWKRNP